MFYYIEGRLAHLDQSFAVLDVGGVGYKLTITQTTYEAMPPHLSVSEPPTVRLYTYMAVREDDVELFGFRSEEELDTFKLLITVSGVGPKAAIAILSVFTPDRLAMAISAEDTKAISKANGIGAKTAARIVLELKDKIARVTAISDDMSADMGISGAASVGSSSLEDAQSALLVLGYTRAEIANAMKKIDTAGKETDAIIRLALKQLSR